MLEWSETAYKKFQHFKVDADLTVKETAVGALLEKTNNIAPK